MKNFQSPHRGSQPAYPDDLDGLLQAFFRSEMPDPWPVLQPPDLDVAAPSRTAFRFRSRLALAASVALLMGGSLWLSGAFQAIEPSLYDSSSGDQVEAKRPVHTNLPDRPSQPNRAAP